MSGGRRQAGGGGGRRRELDPDGAACAVRMHVPVLPVHAQKRTGGVKRAQRVATQAAERAGHQARLQPSQQHLVQLRLDDAARSTCSLAKSCAHSLLRPCLHCWRTPIGGRDTRGISKRGRVRNEQRQSGSSRAAAAAACCHCAPQAGHSRRERWRCTLAGPPPQPASSRLTPSWLLSELAYRGSRPCAERRSAGRHRVRVGRPPPARRQGARGSLLGVSRQSAARRGSKAVHAGTPATGALSRRSSRREMDCMQASGKGNGGREGACTRWRSGPRFRGAARPGKAKRGPATGAGPSEGWCSLEGGREGGPHAKWSSTSAAGAPATAPSSMPLQEFGWEW